jgi:cellulose biosynthesis protein BcsQ
MAIKISIFNHKGGVSKTTTVFHLGWMLTLKKKKVLLVDTDAQCNLTLTVIGYDNYEKFHERHPQQNIKDALSPAFDSKPELIKPVKCVAVPGNLNLLLLPGSFDITEYEVQLGVSFQLSNSFSTMKNLPGSINYLIEETAKSVDADIVLIDVNPSLSAINQDILISSDYFIVPAAPDYFSKMAIRSLARILPSWERWAKQARDIFSSATYQLPMKTPKFLGFTINDFTLKSSRPATSFQNVIDSIEKLVNKEMIPSFRHAGLLLPEDIYKEEYCIAKIPNFHTLLTRYQEYSKPVFSLTDKELGSTGPILERQSNARSRFFNLFSDCADRIIEMIDYAERD